MIRALGVAACVLVASIAYRQTQSTTMRSAAHAFAASLSSEQRARGALAYDDAERLNWHFVPRERRGVALGELNAEQRALANALLRTGLSDKGAHEVDEIVELEGVLRELESNPGRDPGHYYFTLFGDLEKSGSFGWRFEGHHVALNFSSLGENSIAATPHFLGANPARVRGGAHDGLRVLGDEEDLGRELASSFDESQRKLAVDERTQPGDVIYGPGRDAPSADAQGITLAAMTPKQQAAFWKLVDLYVDRFRAEQADVERARLRAMPADALRFIWIGSLHAGEPHYYRIHGPRFAIEYDNVQGGANHVHTLWRDFDRDFGDPLREHYAREHGK